MLPLILALQVNLLLLVLAKNLRWGGVSGVAACVPVGVAVMHFAGMEAYVPFAVFSAGGVLVGLAGSAAEPPRSCFSAANVGAGCLAPLVMAVFWDWLPDPEPCHAALIAGFGAALGNAVFVGLSHAARGAASSAGGVRLSLNGAISATAAGSLVALAGWAAGGILFAHVWTVIAAVAGASFCFSLIAAVLRRRAGIAIRLGNLVSTSIACAAAGALAWAAR